MEKRTFSPILTNRLLPLAFGICSIIPLLSRGQSVISPEKVKQYFMHPLDTATLNETDKMLGQEEYLSCSSNLHRVGDFSLPASNWGVMVDDEKGGYTFVVKNFRLDKPLKQGRKCTLCWMGLRNDASGQEEHIRRKLRKKYGSIKTSDSQHEGIPARWIDNGVMSFSMYVQYYGGMYVGRNDFLFVNQGCLNFGESSESLPRRDSEDPWDYFDKTIPESEENNHLGLRITMLAPELFHTLDSWENFRRVRKAEMLLLAHEANKHCPSAFKKYHSIKDLPIYVYMRRDGRCEMVVLDESRLSEEDKPFVEELAAAFPQTPPLMFDLQFTIDGEMMPGKILYATHTTVWRFREVNQEE